MQKSFIKTRFILLASLIFALRAFGQFDLDDQTGTNRTVVTTDGVTIHCVEKGEGKTILFVPGWTMPGHIWQVQLERFAGPYHVVLMDPRSQGESTQTTNGLDPATRARDIKAVVDQLKLSPVVLVGWSSGVTEIASYINQFGTGTISALVFVDGIAGADLPAGMTAETLPYLEMIGTNRQDYADKFVRGMFKQPHSEAFLTNLIQATLKTPTPSAIALAIASIKTDNRPALAKIDKPTLIAVSTLPQSVYTTMQQQIKGSRVEVFKDAGHALFIDDPDKFDERLNEFLEQTGSKTSAIAPDKDPLTTAQTNSPSATTLENTPKPVK